MTAILKSSSLRKTLLTTFTAAVLATSLAAAPAEARNGRNAALAVGVIGGLALGALALGAGRNRGYGDDDGYHHPAY